MAMKQFKAESKRLLDLMINSIYTHKEIFLRELISNASDAIDKLYYRALQDGLSGLSRDDFSIEILVDKDKRTLIITDNGCGMTKEELENNLGTIAKSGSLNFKNDNEPKEDIEIIGQFGVGFYSAFMVSEHICVESRAYGSDESWRWESNGAEGYTMAAGTRGGHGSSITMTIKADTDENSYSKYLETSELQRLVKKYSDYIRYPIRMELDKSRVIEGTDKDEQGNWKAPEYEHYSEVDVLNSMVPLWRKGKGEVTDEEFNAFYKDKFHDYEDPSLRIQSNTEGTATYNALLFIPARAPYDFYSREYEKGLQLYSNGVMIMEKCADLLPDHFSFMRGLVDSQDLSLNISRETLQHDRQLKLIAGRLEKKIQSELQSLLLSDREKYEAFYKNFGLQLKYGAYADYGVHKELLQELLLFVSSAEQKPVTLKEYVGRMKEEQKFIYYACAENVARAALLPQTEALRDKGYEILYLTDNVDEFVLKILMKYDDKEFRSVSADDLGLLNDEEKAEAERQVEENKDLLTALCDALGGKVKAVVLSKKLKSHPVCLSSEGAVSIEMEKVLGAMPGAQENVKAQRVLEVNANHPVFETLQHLHGDNSGKLAAYAQLLYAQALLIEGMPVDDPVELSNQICALMTE